MKDVPDGRAGSAHGNSVPRQMHVAVLDWPQVQTGRPVDPLNRATASNGNGLMRPLEASARRVGVEFLLEHRMTEIYREQPRSGRVLGIGVTNNGRRINIRARKAVIIGTGGHTGNVNFRRMFDPRLTEEYCGLAGMPWSDQDGSGELAGMAIGASLWGLNIQANETGSGLTKAGKIGCQYGYVNLTWMPGSRVFDKAGASGLRVTDWQNVIMVNMIGKRFYDETGRGLPRQSVQPDQELRSALLSQCEEHQMGARRFHQRGDGRHSRRPAQRRRPDLGDLRCRCGRAREMGPAAPVGRHRRTASSSARTRSTSSPARSK